jgi:hypothetical protein
MNSGKRGRGGLMERADDPTPLQILVAMASLRRKWSEQERRFRRRYQEQMSEKRRQLAISREPL